MKDQNYKSLYQILMGLDDVSENPSLKRHENLLQTLYLQVRHSFISSIVSTQVFIVSSPIIRKNITQLSRYCLRHVRDLETSLGEFSALLEKKTLPENIFCILIQWKPI